MEFVENCQEKSRPCIPKPNQEKRPTKTKCVKKYVQPPRTKPFIPQTVYCPPKAPIDSKTTYHSSFYAENQTRDARPQPFMPVHSINLSDDKFTDDTTTKLCFKPVWGLYKAKPILPRQRLGPQKGRIENQTTTQNSYSAKYAPKPQMIIPCGHIRTSKAVLDGTTTTWQSYMNPGHVERVMSFKPQLQYCQPTEPTAQETTQKLSFLPYEVGKKENYPWAQKPTYRRPEDPMPAETTYSKSYLENKAKREMPIFPKDTCILPCGAEFAESTVYKESFLPRQTDLVSPILPCGNILVSDKKMTCETTNKLSFRQVKGEKRKPIMPRHRKILSETGSMQNITTNQLSFTPKVAKRTEMIIPCGHIRTAKQPLDGKTTTALSFVNPGPTDQIQNYKPALKYCKPDEKIEAETVNKLSYPQWSIAPKDPMPWAEKPRYQRPKDKITTDTVYHMSFPPPGHYVEECDSVVDCPCPSQDRGDR